MLQPTAVWGWAVADASLKCQQDLIIAASSAHGVVTTAKFADTCWVRSQDEKNKKVRRKKALNIVTASSFKSYANVYGSHC